MLAAAGFAFDNTYARELDGCFVAWPPTPARAPRLLFLNRPLARELGLDDALLAGEPGARLFAGNELPDGAQPIAQAYAGHQFGGFSPQLGDGRALLIGEIVDRQGRRRDLAFKGSGRTPFSRAGDGKAAVGPMLREVLVGEAMHALGIPTTRALAVAATGEVVLREAKLPGGVLTRVAASHLRVGTFQYFAARGETERVRRLAEYAIARHDPQLVGQPDRFLAFFEAVARRQAALVAQWMNVGFIHGVMNTDNMTISGETIDYGPCAFLEACDPDAVFSSIDHHGRYAFGNQPTIARWNLARLAEALLPLFDADTQVAVGRAMQVIEAFPGWFAQALLAGQRAKLGLPPPERPDAAQDEADAALADDWLALLQAHRVDFTLGWRRLADVADQVEGVARAHLADGGNTTGADVPAVAAEVHGGSIRTILAPLAPLFGRPEPPAAVVDWLAGWRARRTQVARPLPATSMRQASPWLIPRNHRVEEALAAATEADDLGPFEAMLEALRQPFDERPAADAYAQPAAPEVTACYRTFCGT
ncbi:MAG: hypothetical protein RI988_1099 [Pseudomonadota bacterium]|jgi:uncharacterized protein YdiU (UPF0061 family)